ncbi:MAG: hypothetical protein IJR54_04860 [Oscillibacter sp.]|nr:hypothetical protein [Oscillibacter sp.]
MEHDEDIMIAKLREHRNLKIMAMEIGERCGVPVTPTQKNDSRGDFTYPAEQEEQLFHAMDHFLGPRIYGGADNAKVG